MKKIILILIILITTLNLFSQIAVGEWRDHFSFRDISFITESEDEIIAASQNGLFFIDKEDKTKNKLTKANGLSDIGISTINYYTEEQLLFIGYDNGNIDVIIDNKIINISDIKNKNISAGKEINKVVFIDNFAYLACGFGVVKLNIDNFEIVETYYIGDESSLIQVFDIVLFSDNFYAATEQGLYKAEINNPNLIDFNNWEQIQDIPNFDKNFTSIVNFKNILYTIYQNETTGKKNIYYYKNSTWQLFKENQNSSAILFANPDKLIITTRNKISIYNENLLNVRNIQEYDEKEMNANRVFINSEGVLWIADKYSGIVEENDDYTYEIHSVDGPSYNTYGKLFYVNNNIYSIGGGKKANGANSWNKGVFSWFTDERWHFSSNDDATDYYIIDANPNNPDNIFIGAWFRGIYEYNDFEFTEFYDVNNSEIVGWLNMDNYVHISGLKFDEAGNLWSVNPSTQPLCVRTPDNNWYSFNFDGKIDNKGTGELVIIGNNKWFPVEPQKIAVFNDNNTIADGNDDKYVILNLVDNEGNGFGSRFNAMEKDLDDNIWVGTDKGIATFFNTENAFDEGYFANRIKISGEINDTTITSYLLENDVVKSIAVDGANRKWFGTEDSGVFLISENGTKEIYHFTTENSPLPSNHILSITIHEKTGEVFFSTSYGIMSYKGNATTGKDNFEDIFVYPNPVRPTYSGNIVVTGLVSDVNVKITDVAGNIVFESEALGGQVNWDGNNFSGQRVQTGVYLVFCSNDDGTKTHVTKLLFIN